MKECRYVVGKRQNLCLHNVGENIMDEVFEETIKSSVKRKRQGDIKAAVMYDEKVIVEVINKICNHEKSFTFHNNKVTIMEKEIII